MADTISINPDGTLSLAGRPPKEPMAKIHQPVRCLVTPPVGDVLVAASQLHGIKPPKQGLVPSDILRLYLFRGLEHDGLLTDELRADPTWEALRRLGLA